MSYTTPNKMREEYEQFCIATNHKRTTGGFIAWEHQQAKVDKFESLANTGASLVAELEAKITKLETQLAEAKKDADRYNFIVNHLLTRKNSIIQYQENLTEAIDQAIADEGEK